MRMVFVLVVGLSCAAPLLAQSGELNSQNDAPPGQMRMMHRPGIQPPLPRRHSSVPSMTEVPPGAPVVTLDGICDGAHKAAKRAPCKTVLTRAELDSLVDALMPEASQTVRAQFAINYARTLAAAEVARRRHLEENAAVAKAIHTQEKMARMQVLAASLYQLFEAQSEKLSPAEIQDYYASHAGDYQEGEVQRLILPKSAATESGQPLDLSAVKAIADSMRARAAAGEDLNQLEQEAYKKLAIQNSPPMVTPVIVRRSSLMPDQAKVFDQNPGEISEVADAPGAFVIEKLISKKSISLQDARPGIESALRQQRLQQNLRDAARSVKAEFNLKYFDMTSAPDLFPPPGAGQVANRPGMTSNVRSRGFSRLGLPRTALSPQR